MSTKNPAAIDRAIIEMGGVTGAVIMTANEIRTNPRFQHMGPIPEATWYRWKRAGRVPDPHACFLIALLTSETADALSGLPAGQDVEREGDDATAGRPRPGKVRPGMSAKGGISHAVGATAQADVVPLRAGGLDTTTTRVSARRAA